MLLFLLPLFIILFFTNFQEFIYNNQNSLNNLQKIKKDLYKDAKPPDFIYYYYQSRNRKTLQYNEHKYNTFLTVPSSSRKIIGRGTINVYNTQIHDQSLSCLATCTSTTILPILFLYLNTVTVTAGTFEP
jgi:hypothetical protein